MQITIKPSSGINSRNIPSDIFSMIQSIDDIGGETIIGIAPENVNSVRNVLLNFFESHIRGTSIQANRILSFSSLNGMLIVDLAYQTAPTIPAAPQVAQPVPEPVPGIAFLWPPQDPRVQAVAAPAQATPAPTMVRVEELDPVELEGTDDEPEEKGYHIEKSRAIAVDPCADSDVKILLAKSMKNGLSSSAHVVNEKVTQLNQLLGKTLILQNELDVLLKPIDENPKITYIIKQLQEINLEAAKPESCIKKAYVNKNGDVTILTNRLITEKLEDDEEKRDLGEFEIVISSVAILSENVNASGNIKPILIKNLTHYASDGNVSWACGHIQANGEACFGQVYPQIHRALLDKNLTLAIELLVRFIRNPDIDDGWGQAALYFPKVGDTNP